MMSRAPRSRSRSWARGCAAAMSKGPRSVKGSDLADDDETMGWLALYDGDLVTARKRLVRAETRRPELVDALGLLARTRVDRLPGLGQAFLLMAKRDTLGAAQRFTALADSTGDAAPAMLAIAARLGVRPTGQQEVDGALGSRHQDVSQECGSTRRTALVGARAA